MVKTKYISKEHRFNRCSFVAKKQEETMKKLKKPIILLMIFTIINAIPLLKCSSHKTIFLPLTLFINKFLSA